MSWLRPVGLVVQAARNTVAPRSAERSSRKPKKRLLEKGLGECTAGVGLAGNVFIFFLGFFSEQVSGIHLLDHVDLFVSLSWIIFVIPKEISPFLDKEHRLDCIGDGF